MRDPLTVAEISDADERWYSLVFSPRDIPELVAASRAAKTALSGYVVQEVARALGEDAGPEFDALQFDSESSSFCVRCDERAPLERFAGEFRELLHDRRRLQRMMRAAGARSF